MSHADSIRDRLRAAAEPLATADCAPAPVRQLALTVGRGDDLLDAAEAMIPLILAVEECAEALAAHARRLRDRMAEALDESGATTIRGVHHVASIGRNQGVVVVTDPAAVPAELMRRPEPVPDKARIAKLLHAGVPVSGCSLGNRGPLLTIRPRERERART